MKTIPIEIDSTCRACHGDTIVKAIETILAEKYTVDAVTGCKPGELRGALSISKILNNERIGRHLRP